VSAGSAAITPASSRRLDRTGGAEPPGEDDLLRIPVDGDRRPSLAAVKAQR
jgi:hypothetical protein